MGEVIEYGDVVQEVRGAMVSRILFCRLIFFWELFDKNNLTVGPHSLVRLQYTGPSILWYTVPREQYTAPTL